MSSTLVYTSSREADAARAKVETVARERQVRAYENRRADLSNMLRNLLANCGTVAVGIKVCSDFGKYRLAWDVIDLATADECAESVAWHQTTEGDVEAWAYVTVNGHEKAVDL